MQDYADLLQTHRSSNADITIATHAVGLGQASFRGCCKVEPDTGSVLATITASGCCLRRLTFWSLKRVFLIILFPQPPRRTKYCCKLVILVCACQGVGDIYRSICIPLAVLMQCTSQIWRCRNPYCSPSACFAFSTDTAVTRQFYLLILSGQ